MQNARRERGFVLVLGIIILLAVSITIASKLSSVGLPRNAISQGSIIRTQKLAKEAKWALIGYAATNTAKPGTLPCLADDASGSANSLNAKCRQSASPTEGRLTGCLPWRTLGLEHTLDESGAPLLYSLSTGWRNTLRTEDRTPDNDTDTASYKERPINPGNPGTISIHSSTASNTLAIATILSSGYALTTQDRSGISEAALCSGTGLINFLDSTTDSSGVVVNNATDNMALISAQTSATFNDKIVTISREEIIRPLMPTVLRSFGKRDPPYPQGLTDYYANNRSGDTATSFAVLAPTVVSNVQQVRDTGSFPDRYLMNRARNQTTANDLDWAIMPARPALVTSLLPLTTPGKYCLPNNVNGPADWLCYNNWYSYIEYTPGATPTVATVMLVANRAQALSWKCILVSNNEKPTCGFGGW